VSESIQPMLSLNTNGQTPVTGVTLNTLDGIFGAGSVAINQSFVGQIWTRIRRNATGDNVFVQDLGIHNFIHPLTDPTHAGPSYIVRITEVIAPSFGASVGRIFFGFGEFIDVTDALSLRGAGFYCDETGNWFALLSDAVGDRVRFDTTADTNQPRLLRMDIDGILKEVRWYVDDVLRVTHVMSSPLDQIGAGVGVFFVDVIIQSDAGNQIDAFIAAGIIAQMSLVTAPVV